MSESRIGRLSPAVRWLLAGAVAILIGGALGYWAGERAPSTMLPSAPSAASAAASAPLPAASASASWSSRPALPPQPPAQDGLRWPLWEFELQAGVPARAEALTPPPWRFVGAVLVDGDWRLIVLRQGATEPEFYKKGDRLPGGYTIRDIGQEDVTLLAGRREIVLSYIGSS